MKIYKKRILKKKLEKYKIIIFDLDNTIYNEKNFIYPSLKNVSKFLTTKIDIHENEIQKQLLILKNKNQKIFDKFLSNFLVKKINLKSLVKRTINKYQSYNCNNLKNVNSLKNILKFFYKKKKLFLVTNGNRLRQKNKIKKLGINKFFKKIYILDNDYDYIKPSTKSVNSLKKFIKKIGFKNAVYVGDNKITDKAFAKNLKISFINFYFKE